TGRGEHPARLGPRPAGCRTDRGERARRGQRQPAHRRPAPGSAVGERRAQRRPRGTGTRRPGGRCPAVTTTTDAALRTIADLPFVAADRYGDRAAWRFLHEGGWVDRSFAEAAEDIRALAEGLVEAGI